MQNKLNEMSMNNNIPNRIIQFGSNIQFRTRKLDFRHFGDDLVKKFKALKISQKKLILSSQNLKLNSSEKIVCRDLKLLL